jgi:hypothetical protein
MIRVSTDPRLIDDWIRIIEFDVAWWSAQAIGFPRCCAGHMGAPAGWEEGIGQRSLPFALLTGDDSA